MTDIVFDNTRFDPDLTSFHDHAKNMAQAFGYTAKLTIDQELAQLLRLRVAQINACAYCLILHRKDRAGSGHRNRPYRRSGKLARVWRALFRDRTCGAGLL